MIGQGRKDRAVSAPGTTGGLAHGRTLTPFAEGSLHENQSMTLNGKGAAKREANQFRSSSITGANASMYGSRTVK